LYFSVAARRTVQEGSEEASTPVEMSKRIGRDIFLM
jgi:hypothetical protein